MTIKQEKIQKLMEKLNITEQEALKLIADDDAIDHGAKLFELSKEQEQVSKEARQVSRAPTVYKLDNAGGKRSRKSDEDKEFLSNILFSAILPICDSYNVINVGREFEFTYHGRKFKVVLSAPRT